MTTYYVVHNGPQGNGDGLSVANGRALQTALNSVTAGDSIYVCATGTYSLSAQINIYTIAGTPASPILVTGANSSGVVDGTRPTINMGGYSLFSINQHYYIFQYLSGTSNTSNNSSMWGGDGLIFVFDCDFTASGTGGLMVNMNPAILAARCTSSGGQYGFYTYKGGIFVECIAANTTYGFESDVGYAATATYIDCIAYNCTDGFQHGVQSGGGQALTRCLAYECTNGIHVFENGVGLLVSNCTFADCVDGANIEGTGYGAMVFDNCIFAYNSAYGINNASSVMGGYTPYIKNCAFYSNTTGNLHNGSLNATNLTTTAPSFVDRVNATLSSRNYSLSAGSGLTSHSFTNLLNKANYPDIGAFQQNPDFPAVASVLTSDTVNGATGTYTEVATTDVKRNVTFGPASGYTGTYDANVYVGLGHPAGRVLIGR